MTDNKTKPTDMNVQEFLKTVSKKRSDEAEQLIAIMRAVSGQPPVMWGPSIIGFGKRHYAYDTGRQGDTCTIGFSPRKSALTIYINEGFDRYGAELQKLGRVTHSVSCLYIKSLADIDMDTLRNMIQQSYIHNTSDAPTVATVDAYIARIPSESRAMFDKLRAIVRSQIPDANEVLSYGIIGYKIDDKRARVYISGWKDHVALYPVPKSKKLAAALRPYVKGKGTLWFALDQPLPATLVESVVDDLARA